MAKANGILRSGIEKLRAEVALKKLDRERIPAHVAVIMDGNGRWAKRRGLPRIDGHRAGADSLRSVVIGCTDLGIRYLTAYTFSSENWQRPTDEVSGLMELFREQLEREIDELDGERIRVRVLGRLDEVPAETRASFESAMERTAHHERLQLILALNYGGRVEIADAARRLAQEAVSASRTVESIDADAVASHLYAPDVPDPDLVIRTGGNLRISNYLLWQSAYAEMCVVEKLWPDFRRSDFFRALAEFQHRERRFGRLTSED